MKQQLVENLNYLKSLSVEEETLYKKWYELNHNFPYKSEQNKSKGWLWKPTNIFDKELTISEIQSLQPYVFICESQNDIKKWDKYRRLIHTMSYSQNPGRIVKSFVLDRVSGKLLGLISLSSDVTSLKVRDGYIGWNKYNKFIQKRINNSCIATTIVPTQPLGYNFLGGKLISVLTTSDVLRNHWEQKYGDKLICVTTTSLYGVQSQYNGIPHFKTLGESLGKMGIIPDTHIYKPLHNWLKDNHSEWYENNISVKKGKNGVPISGIKQKILSKLMFECGLKMRDYQRGFNRGVFISMMYENGCEFLRGEINQSELKLKDRFVSDDNGINWWKDKSIKRYTKLLEEGRLKEEHLWYTDISKMSWDETKSKYLNEVGR